MSLHPTIIPRSEHSLSRDHVSPCALKVLYQLKDAGFDAYLVGGCVRDLLLNKPPKDFDVATNAKPEEVAALFKNCRLIGRRFRLAHVRFRREIIEVATFRSQLSEESKQVLGPSGMILRDNVYGSLAEDAWRRDFTVNALYYNIKDFSVVDYTGGLADLNLKLLRIIGDPHVRYQEDPIRMLRALRFAAKLELTLDQETAAPFSENAQFLLDVPSMRLYEEIVKCFLCGQASTIFSLLCDYAFFPVLFPLVQQSLEKDEAVEVLIRQSLKNTDERLCEDKTVNPAFIFAALLWYPMRKLVVEYQAQDLTLHMAHHQAFSKIFKLQSQSMLIPRRLSYIISDIWIFQLRLEQRTPKRVARLLQQKRFRAAYDFLLLRASVGEIDSELADWWTLLQKVNPKKRADMIAAVQKESAKKRLKKQVKKEK